MAARGKNGGILWRIAPPRFLLFLVLFAAGVPAGIFLLGWREGVMAGFDLAAIAFILACLNLFDDEADEMRADARANDANRPMLLAIVILVSLVILAAVAAELAQQGAAEPRRIALVIATLTLCWAFSNLVYALHYAHLFYLTPPGARGGGKDSGGIVFPGEKEPDYWDFFYFAATLGMTFQTSDMNIESRRIRRTATFHCIAAFVFNLGIVAFTINVLGG